MNRKGLKKGVIRTPEKISIRLTPEQREWLDGCDNVSEYIRDLIEEDMFIQNGGNE